MAAQGVCFATTSTSQILQTGQRPPKMILNKCMHAVIFVAREDNVCACFPRHARSSERHERQCKHVFTILATRDPLTKEKQCNIS
jgi:hypothetical protein